MRSNATLVRRQRATATNHSLQIVLAIALAVICTYIWTTARRASSSEAAGAAGVMIATCLAFLGWGTCRRRANARLATPVTVWNPLTGAEHEVDLLDLLVSVSGVLLTAGTALSRTDWVVWAFAVVAQLILEVLARRLSGPYRRTKSIFVMTLAGSMFLGADVMDELENGRATGYTVLYVSLIGLVFSLEMLSILRNAELLAPDEDLAGAISRIASSFAQAMTALARQTADSVRRSVKFPLAWVATYGLNRGVAHWYRTTARRRAQSRAVDIKLQRDRARRRHNVAARRAIMRTFR